MKSLRKWRIHLTQRLSLMSILRRVVGAVVILQCFTVIVLLVVSAVRNRKQKQRSFPHIRLEEVRVGANRLRLYSYGRELYDAMLEAIDGAQESIYIESYIWKDDEVGREFRDHLAAKAVEGVPVYVIFDTFANLVVPRAFKSSFPKPIHVLEFQALRHPLHMFDPRRYSLDHRKMLIVDGSIGFIGGYNIGSLYATQWRDTHISIRGPAASELACSFTDFWNRFCHKNDKIKRQYRRCFDPLINLRGNDALRLTFPIRDMYIDAIDKAEHSILLTNAYFVPDRVLLGALKEAAQRGVDVRILVPWVSNHIVSDWVSHGYFSDCLKSGVRIFSYRHAMLHAKTCTIDGQWSTIGTANLDRLSSIGNYEINVEIYSTELAHQMRILFECDTADTFELTLKDWLSRPWYTKMGEFILAPLRFIM
jgi:cardiolipin synthase